MINPVKKVVNEPVKKYLCDFYNIPARVVDIFFETWVNFKNVDLTTVKDRIEKIQNTYNFTDLQIRKMIITNSHILLANIKSIKTKQEFFEKEYGVNEEDFKKILYLNSEALLMSPTELSQRQVKFEEICDFNRKQFGRLLSRVNIFPKLGIVATKNKIDLLMAFGIDYADIMRLPSVFTVPYDKLVTRLIFVKMNNYPSMDFLTGGYRRSEGYVYARMKAIQNKEIEKTDVFQPEHTFIENGLYTTKFIEKYPFNEEAIKGVYEEFMKKYPSIYEKFANIEAVEEKEYAVLGVTEDEYYEIVSVNKELHDYSLEHIQKYQVFFSSKLYIPKQAFFNTIIKNPNILKYNFKDIQKAFEDLKKIVGKNRYDAIKIIRTNEEILEKGIDFYIDRLKFLTEMFGLSEDKYKNILANNREIFNCSTSDIIKNQEDLQKNSNISKIKYSYMLTKIHSMPSFSSKELNDRIEFLEKIGCSEEDYNNSTRIGIIDPKIDIITRLKLYLLNGKTKDSFVKYGAFSHEEDKIYARWRAIMDGKIEPCEIYCSNDTFEQESGVKWYEVISKYPLGKREKEKIDVLFEQRFPQLSLQLNNKKKR